MTDRIATMFFWLTAIAVLAGLALNSIKGVLLIMAAGAVLVAVCAVALVIRFMNNMAALSTRQWRCKSCGHAWREPAME
ncbi:MAG: hypothetical protein HZA89_08340 [Verrucomicrobia bacterium]|nr:hypothetical protein [Verrucomicrobiota bacterium]